MSIEPILEVDGLSHRYGEHLVLDDVSFSAGTGELLSIVGPSGAGKTTLLRSLSGLMTPTSGALTFEGEPIRGVPDDLAMVFQDYSRSLPPWLSVVKNVMFPLVGISAAEKRERAEQSLQAVGLEGQEHKYPWQLSGGMQQRVAIARALAYQPRLLLMDEPFASLDAQTREDLEDLVLSLRELFGMTILFVTHDITESVYLADRVLVLSSSPATVKEIVSIPIDGPRDQIATKERDDFVRLRSHVARLIRAESHAAKSKV